MAKKHLATLIVCISLLSATFIQPCLSRAADYQFVTQLATSYFESQNFDGLSSLYLLPDHYSTAQKREETTVIREALRFLAGEFGTTNSLRLNQEDILWFEFMVTVGDMEFLENHDDYLQRVYSADFKTVGEGFVILQLIKNTDQPRLRGVGLALPANPDNAVVVQRIAEKLSQPN